MLFNVFFFKVININPTIEPEKKAIKRATKILGKERKRPIKVAIFTSPNPIPLPFVTNNIKRKKTAAPSALNNGYWMVDNRYWMLDVGCWM